MSTTTRSKRGSAATSAVDAVPEPHATTRAVKRTKRAAGAASKEAPLPLACPWTEVGHVFVVGSGDCGQLGLGPDVLEKERPAKLALFDDEAIVAVFAGGLHNIVLSAQGQLWSWGCNDQFALGREGEETLPLPITALHHERIVNVALGDSISAALTADGRVYAWGTFRDKTGIFGFSPTALTQKLPVQVAGLSDVVSIAAGTNHLIAVTRAGKVLTWGCGEQNQLGRRIMPRQVNASSLLPRPINFKPSRGSSRFVAAFSGGYHTWLVHESKRIFGFGLNNWGQLGAEGAAEEGDGEELVGLDDVRTMAGGEHHSMACDEQGRVWTWGRGDSGQIGHLPMTSSQRTPKLLPGLENVRAISCGSAFSLALTHAGEVYGFGYGEMGQLANDCEDVPSPTRIDLKGRRVLHVSGGGQHTIFLIQPKI